MSNNEIPEYDHFDDIECLQTSDGNLLKGIYAYGFEKPSLIQSKTISLINSGVDIIAQSQAGTGKTGAFVIGLLSKINISLNSPQAIIIATTKELTEQIHRVVQNISKYMDIKSTLCVGGRDKSTKQNILECRNSHIIVGTPGRLIDVFRTDSQHPNKKKLLDNVKMLILDEADALLENDFEEQTKTIIQFISNKCQIIIFSATYTPEVLEKTEYFMENPISILLEKDKLTLDLIKNYYVDAQYEKHKFGILTELYQKINICQAIIFVNSKTKADDISERLRNKGHIVGTIHGGLSAKERVDILRDFRNTHTRVLVATNVISRGIDVEQVGLVINYDIPDDPELYIHRIGRSGRYGKSGIAINLITEKKHNYSNMTDRNYLERIEELYNIKMEKLPSLNSLNHFLTGVGGYNL
jgi:superfamily II DNA/RNA helicase